MRTGGYERRRGHGFLLVHPTDFSRSLVRPNEHPYILGELVFINRSLKRIAVRELMFECFRQKEFAQNSLCGM